MSLNVGLFRAVNLGGSTQLKMSALTQLMSQLGYEEVHTVLQSGNVVFRFPDSDPGRIEHALEQAVSHAFDLTTDCFVRTSSEWHAIVQQNPFPSEAATDPAHLVVTTLKRAPSPLAWRALRAAIRGREGLAESDRHAYIVYPDGIGTSKLTSAVIERTPGTRGTSRNWNTVRKLDQLAMS